MREDLAGVEGDLSEVEEGLANVDGDAADEVTEAEWLRQSTASDDGWASRLLRAC